ncbi:unnamed protein product [Paramecium pentaurelia]|uniref:Uncharacterized protein n=1 Tax=Paramecium pentaurelia TaxID=43138 RepID=A0A8S1YAU6_9CILI|nr:unnamed protein product [Paramecium pentaurelia]
MMLAVRDMVCGVDTFHQVTPLKLDELEFQIAIAFINIMPKIRIHRRLTQYNTNKYLQFIDNNGVDHIYEMPIQEGAYEFVWYFIGFEMVPIENRFTIYFSNHEKLVQTHQIQIEFPFYDEKLNLIFGGDLSVKHDQQLHNSENEKLSYFPGQVLILNYYQISQQQYCNTVISFILSSQIDECRCVPSQNTKINDQVIQKKEEFLFISSKTNCQQFLLSGWIKIDDIHTFVDEFDYQFIKLSGNFQVTQMTDDNLSPFTLTYKISSKGNQMIITTYSYTFPSINIDFSNNPYLIKQAFHLIGDIKLWHYLFVKKQETNIYISITFFELYKQEKFEIYEEVKQFNLVQFKLLYGNILQSHSDYLKIQIVGFQLFNCPQKSVEQLECHSTCQECDGPTKTDCLSCFESLNRKYLPDFKECICEYGTVDMDNQCITYERLNLTIVTPDEVTMQSCKYGYFEFDNACFRCPSTIMDNVVTCLECLQNPKEWMNMLYCETSLYSDDDGNISQYIYETDLCYKFVGNDLTYYLCEDECLDCQFFEEFNSIIQQKQLSSDKSMFIIAQITYCLPPYFLNFEKICTLCNIEFCLYCFSYFGNDQTKTTLNQKFQYSIIGEEIKTGCIQCIDGFIYSFEKEQCIYKNPAISNCLRSYLTAEGQEICTVSSIDDFNIAPEIINCQKRILKCKQCIQTPELIIKCIICEDGYMASAYSGICTECSYQINSKICVEWNQKNLEPWKWLIQGFRIQFLKITNFYHELVSIIPMSYVIQCLDGYQIILNQCYQYCDDNCQVCRNMKIDNQQQFYCQKCDLNYFKKNNRGHFQGKCINCPSLCQTCVQRSNDQIEKINPFFQINEENSIYTLKCIQKVPLQKVTIDPNLQIAHYCFNENCDDMFEYNVHFFCRTLELLDQDSYSGYLEQKLNYKYFNEIGLKRITLILLFNTICENFQVKNYSFLNYIREKVFSIQQIKLRIEGQLKPFLLLIQFKIQYFDSIKINQVMFLIRTQLKLILNNRGQSIDFNIVDTSFYSDQSDPIQIQIYGDNYRNFNLQNVQFFDVIVYNAIIFQIMCSDVGEIIKIKELKLSNCIFNNTTLLDFLNMRRQIIVDNLSIKSCHFYNSSIITLNLNLNQFADIIINNVYIQDSFFQESSFLYSYGNSTITINKFTLAKSSIFSSRIISFSKDFYFNEIILQENFFKEAQFLIQLSSSFMNSQIQINNFTIFKNQVSNFSAFVTEQKYERNKVNLKLDNFKFEYNIQDTQDYYSYLFKINCQTLLINDIELKGTYNFRFFSLIAIPTIKLENIIYENQQQQEKVEITFDCYKNSAVHSSLLLVSGFSNIILLQIQITNQFSIDQSIITIQSNPLINFNTVESILISHISFIGNILVKQNLGMLFSLIQIYSEKTLNIAIFNVIYKENIFHQYQADPSENSASLILIQSGQSKIMMTNIICSYNALTNSSNSFISINSNSLVIKDFQAFHHNYFEAELWNKYYQVYIQSQYNLNQITLIIKNAFKIETKSGALSITASNVNFTNGLFSYIIASSSLIFNINLQGQGIVIIKNCDILHAQSQSISTSKVDGAITINAKKSLLTIDIENLVLKEVQNTLSSSIFSIYPSSTNNRIFLNKIHAYNCFSLFNQFLYLEFDYKNVAQNEVLIQNLHFIQTDTAFMLYLQSIETVNPIEIQKITQDNAIINIIGCKVQMKGLFIEGIVSSGIIKIMDYSSIFFTNSLFQNISTFYPVNILDFTQNNLFHSDLLLNNISILNVNSFQYNKSKLNYFDLNIHLQLNQCKLIINEVLEPIQELVSINQFFEEILANSNKKGSLIHLNSITNQTQLLLRKIQFINNNCQHCWNGLLNFELTQIKVIKLSQFECILNFIKKHGCILAILENILDRSIIIDHSNFISNHGTKGTGVQVQNL